ncbi:hypothetical protein TNCV_2173991 [Trichonephila clavipes]|nr:hypothetical protein TNCV_2173991 [Trichonephila clavipes]
MRLPMGGYQSLQDRNSFLLGNKFETLDVMGSSFVVPGRGGAPEGSGGRMGEADEEADAGGDQTRSGRVRPRKAEAQGQGGAG